MPALDTPHVHISMPESHYLLAVNATALMATALLATSHCKIGPGASVQAQMHTAIQICPSTNAHSYPDLLLKLKYDFHQKLKI